MIFTAEHSEMLAERHMCIVWDGDHPGIPRQGLLQPVWFALWGFLIPKLKVV